MTKVYRVPVNYEVPDPSLNMLTKKKYMSCGHICMTKVGGFINEKFTKVFMKCLRQGK